jgi:hypothetical protein
VDDAGWAAVMSVDGDTLCAVDLERLLTRPEWHRRAACRGMGVDRWFIDRGGDPRPAKAICAGCPVTAECAAASEGEQGIWAGQSTHRQARAQRARRGAA